MRKKRKLDGTIVMMLAGLLAMGACGGAAGDGSDRHPTATGSGVNWERDLAAALARAGSEDKLVMVDFYTDWCGWCRRLDETTYADASVQEALQGIVTVKLNAEKEGRREAARFRVEGYPTVVVVDAAGNEVGRIPGYLPPAPFLEELQDILARA